MNPSSPVKVFVVDDHPLFREGLVQYINRESDMEVCGEAGDTPSALSALNQLKADIAVVDLTLQGISGLQLVKVIATQHKKTHVLVLSMHDERLYAERALRAGAKGYIMKQEAPREVVMAIRQVLAGKIYLSEALSKHMITRMVANQPLEGAAPVDVLSNRELEVFDYIGQGFQTREISEKLHLSVKTVESHREHIKNKLNLANSTEVIRRAIQWVHSEKGENEQV